MWSDIARTEAFYNETLGLELARMERAEPFWLQGRLSGGLELVFFQMPAKRGDSPAVVFNVDDGGIDDIVAELATRGVTIVTPVSEAPGGLERRLSGPGWLWSRALATEDKPRSLKTDPGPRAARSAHTPPPMPVPVPVRERALSTRSR